MKESANRNAAVIDMERYRTRVQQAHREEAEKEHPILPNALLDVISYHLLMAARAIAAYDRS